jgi:chromosome segregation ATPase
MMAEDLTIEILKQIRDEVVNVRVDLGTRIDTLSGRVDRLGERVDHLSEGVEGTNVRLDETNSRLGAVEATLLELSEQQRFVVRHLSALTTRDRALEAGLEALRHRVDAIEKQIGPR